MKRRARQQPLPQPKAAKRHAKNIWQAWSQTESAKNRSHRPEQEMQRALFQHIKVVCVELKAPGGRLSPAQRETIAALKAAGAGVEVADTLDDALRHLEHWGILKGTAQ